MGKLKSGFEFDWKVLNFMLEMWFLDYIGGRLGGKGVICLKDDFGSYMKEGVCL